MEKKHLLLFCLGFFLLLSSCGDYASGMPAANCMRKCTQVNPSTGEIETYAIAIRAISWYNTDEFTSELDYGCHAYIYGYRGKINDEGEFEEGSLVYRLEDKEVADDDSDPTYKLTFYDASLDDDDDDGTSDPFSGTTDANGVSLSFTKEQFYSLLLDSSLTLTQGNNEYYASYNHIIDPCSIDKSVDVVITCNTDLTKIVCNYEDSHSRHAQCGNNCQSASCYEDGGQCDKDINMEDITSEYLKEVFSKLDEKGESGSSESGGGGG